MASMLDGMFQTILGNVPGSPQQQQKQTTYLNNQNTDLVNQSVSFKLAQDKLQADANNQLIPLQVEASKNKLQDEIGKAQLSMFMQPYQKEMMQHALADSMTYGSDSQTGMTGQPDIDAQIDRIRKQTNLSIAMKPENAGSQLADSTRAISELRKAGLERKQQQLQTFSSHVSSTPMDSLLKEAEAKPDDPMYQFIKAAKVKNPDITNDQLRTQVDRVFGMDAKERETAGYHDAEQAKWYRDSLEKAKEFKQRHDDRIYQIDENSKSRQLASQQRDDARQDRSQERQDKANEKQDVASNTTVTKSLNEYAKVNQDDKARGTGSTISAIRTFEGVTGGKPVNVNNVYEAMTRGTSPDGTVDANQIAALNTVKAQLSKYYANSGQKSVNDILSSERSAGILPETANKVGAWIFGGGSTKLNDKNDRVAFANVLTKLHDQMVEDVSSKQIEKTNISLSDPTVKSEHKLRFAANILEDPNSMMPTKVNTANKLLEDLSTKGVNISDQDAVIIPKLLTKIKSPSNPGESKLASQQLLKLYNKYTTQPKQSDQQPQQPATQLPGVIVPPLTGMSEDEQRAFMRQQRMNRS